MMRKRTDVSDFGSPYLRSQCAGILVILLLVTAVAGPAFGQRPVGRNFEENAPAVGAVIPDLAVYDPDGVEHRLRDLLGERYTVLILGCLT